MKARRGEKKSKSSMLCDNFLTFFPFIDFAFFPLISVVTRTPMQSRSDSALAGQQIISKPGDLIIRVEAMSQFSLFPAFVCSCGKKVFFSSFEFKLYAKSNVKADSSPLNVLSAPVFFLFRLPLSLGELRGLCNNIRGENPLIVH